jgi:hypothetical protein
MEPLLQGQQQEIEDDDYEAVATSSSFRNPSPAWRAVAVALVLALPGTLAGALLGLCAGWDFEVCWFSGGVLGALIGAAVERDLVLKG